MRLFKYLSAAALACAALTAPAQAAEPLKIGFVVPLSGPMSEFGRNMLNGAKIYMQHHGDTVAGRKVEIIFRDDTGVAPEVTRRVAQEFVSRENVDILTGFGVTAGAISAATVATASKTPMVIMNAATSSVTEKSPYIVRTSMALPQSAAAIATWALANGIKTVFTSVADYGPGHDAESQFVKTFTASGGKIIGQVRTPVQNPDFAPYLQRIRDASPKPDALFMFVPSGEQGVSFLKSYADRGLKEAGIKLIATGDLTDDYVLDAMGDPALGLITAFHYSAAHDSPLNKKFVGDYNTAFPGVRPNFMSAAAYDAMHLIYETLKKTNGDASGDAFVAAAKGMRWESPRGMIYIDPDTRDIVQDVYIREVKRVDGHLYNIEFDVVKEVKDPVKAAAK
jgi:branched-chain amino acid transport system substrate-binding protein